MEDDDANRNEKRRGVYILERIICVIGFLLMLYMILAHGGK